MEINKEFATLTLPDKESLRIPVITDNMGGKSIDIHALRKETGYITYDPGFMNTGSCISSICYVNGEEGILRYRGYDIQDLVEHCDFVEVAYLLIKGELPDESERKRYSDLLNKESLLHYDMQSFFRGYPFDAHPMSVLAAM
ncbi:MAG: citrate/2-methylcitrate synthase, partial [Sphaerochaetaceae bacterium]